MPYITIMQTHRTHQITLEEIIRGQVTLVRGTPPNTITGTRTFFVQTLNDRYAQSVDIDGFDRILDEFLSRQEELFRENRSSLYHTFRIPKRSGGFRKIDEPLPQLMEALRQLKAILEDFGAPLYHTSAFAYVRGRCTIDAIKRHQRNESHWFLKTDFSDFFGSINEKFLIDMISKIYPFSEYVKINSGYQKLSKALNLCFLNGGLPQGTPISPMLTNIIMIPIDHRIMNDIAKNGYVYTRYADDIQISHREKFDPSAMCAYIGNVLRQFNAPFQLKNEKTRFGSSSGRNWNLGVMLNRDNRITIGRKKKLQLKAACVGFVRDHQSGSPWDITDVQVLNGQLCYYKMVEREYVYEFIKWFNEKHHVNLKRMIRERLRQA